MGSRGPHKKQKPEAKFAPGVPEPDDQLNPVARDEYIRAAGEIEASGMDLRQVDFAVLETYAIAFAEVREITAILRQKGRTQILPNGIEALHPLCGELARAQRTLLQACRLLGFAPTERKKITGKQPGKVDNPFEQYVK
jgi:P27 family predicted phage terminase small subunit